MSVSKFKRALWVLKEFADASPRGISAQELSDKWEYSSMNDEKEPGIPERTFHRIRRAIESAFGVVIECIKGTEPRYRVASKDLEPGDNSLLNLFLNKAEAKDDDKSKSVREILGLIMSGSDIPSRDMEAVKDIIYNLRRVPYEYGKQLMDAVASGKINGADECDWDEDYRGYVCVWNDADYHRTDLWLSIGIYDNRVLFYIVTSVQDKEYRERISDLLQINNGEMYRSDCWWYEPADKSLFQLDFQTFPDMQEVKRRVELLISRIASLPEEIHHPEE